MTQKKAHPVSLANSQKWRGLISDSSGNIRRLANVWRYSSIPISVPENVADHSYYVAVYAMMIHQELANQLAKPALMKPEIVAAILLKAVVHDVREAVTGDLVRPFKYSTPEFKEAVDAAEHNMAKKLLPAQVLNMENLAERMAGKQAAYVGAVVKAADFMSLYQFMRREVLRGNCEIRDFVGRLVKDLTSMVDIQPIRGLAAYYLELSMAAQSLHTMTRKMREESHD